MKTDMDKKRDEAAEDFPRVYELMFMNADTPKLSGSEYLTQGFRAGWDACNEELGPLIEALIKQLEVKKGIEQ